MHSRVCSSSYSQPLFFSALLSIHYNLSPCQPQATKDNYTMLSKPIARRPPPALVSIGGYDSDCSNDVPEISVAVWNDDCAPLRSFPSKHPSGSDGNNESSTLVPLSSSIQSSAFSSPCRGPADSNLDMLSTAAELRRRVSN